MATKKTTGKKNPGRSASSTPKAPTPKSMPKGGRDPKGGLTAKGREFFNEKEGSHLRPGVQGPADTPEKMVRKGSFLRRHFANPRGPMKDAKGEPTRLALSAHAWGEPLPQTVADAKKLAAEGHELLEQYHELKDAAPTKAKSTPATAKGRHGAGQTSAGKSAAKKTAAKKTVKTVAKKRTASKAPTTNS